jgi:MSHA biogenesis protein MshI
MKIPLFFSLIKPKKHASGWISVSFGEHGVYVAAIKLVGALPSVVRCEYNETGTATADSLENLRRETDIDDHDVTTLLAPGEYQMLLVDAPNVPVDEMKTAVRWKIKDGLNYHIDDATVDMVRIPASKYASGRPQSLYAIAASNSIIQERIRLFDEAKIGLDVIDIPEMAQRNIAKLFERDDRALVVLAFDDYGGLMTFSAGGELYLSRRIEIGVGQLLDADENLRSNTGIASKRSCIARWIILIASTTICLSTWCWFVCRTERVWWSFWIPNWIRKYRSWTCRR